MTLESVLYRSCATSHTGRLLPTVQMTIHTYPAQHLAMVRLGSTVDDDSICTTSTKMLHNISERQVGIYVDDICTNVYRSCTTSHNGRLGPTAVLDGESICTIQTLHNTSQWKLKLRI